MITPILSWRTALAGAVLVAGTFSISAEWNDATMDKLLANQDYEAIRNHIQTYVIEPKTHSITAKNWLKANLVKGHVPLMLDYIRSEARGYSSMCPTSEEFISVLGVMIASLVLVNADAEVMWNQPQPFFKEKNPFALFKANYFHRLSGELIKHDAAVKFEAVYQQAKAFFDSIINQNADTLPLPGWVVNCWNNSWVSQWIFIASPQAGIKNALSLEDQKAQTASIRQASYDATWKAIEACSTWSEFWNLATPRLAQSQEQIDKEANTLQAQANQQQQLQSAPTSNPTSLELLAQANANVDETLKAMRMPQQPITPNPEANINDLSTDQEALAKETQTDPTEDFTQKIKSLTLDDGTGGEKKN